MRKTASRIQAKLGVSGAKLEFLEWNSRRDARELRREGGDETGDQFSDFTVKA